MSTKTAPTFKYNFRGPGSKVEGPIRYAVGQTVVGKILIGRSENGVCAIFLGSEATALLSQLAGEFPGVELQSAQAALQVELGQVTAFIDKDTAEGVVNLDIGGTPFEQRVWQALCGIPAGETRSYGEVAQHLGVPEAVRAVAGACAANVLAVAIPCHRVVRSNGELSGYRWGVDRKRALLSKESAE